MRWTDQWPLPPGWITEFTEVCLCHCTVLVTESEQGSNSEHNSRKTQATWTLAVDIHNLLLYLLTLQF